MQRKVKVAKITSLNGMVVDVRLLLLLEQDLHGSSLTNVGTYCVEK